MPATVKKYWILAALAVALCAAPAAVFLLQGGPIALAPDTAQGAMADTGRPLHNLDRFSVYTHKASVFFRLPGKRGRVRIKDALARPVTALAVNVPSKILATAGNTGSIELWDISPLSRLIFRTPRHVARLAGDLSNIRAMAFSPGGTVLAALGNEGRTVEVWDISGKKLLATSHNYLPPEKSFVLAVRLSDQGEVEKITMDEARPAYFKDEISTARKADKPETWILRDTLSQRAINAEGLCRADSWSAQGRYLGYAQDPEILIWKLCPKNFCETMEKDGRFYLQ